MRYICKAQPYAVLVRERSHVEAASSVTLLQKDICAGMNRLLTGLVLLFFALLFCFAYFKDVALLSSVYYLSQRNLLLPTSLFLCSQFVIFPLADF